MQCRARGSTCQTVWDGTCDVAVLLTLDVLKCRDTCVTLRAHGMLLLS